MVHGDDVRDAALATGHDVSRGDENIRANALYMATDVVRRRRSKSVQGANDLAFEVLTIARRFEHYISTGRIVGDRRVG